MIGGGDVGLRALPTRPRALVFAIARQPNKTGRRIRERHSTKRGCVFLRRRRLTSHVCRAFLYFSFFLFISFSTEKTVLLLTR